MSHNEPFESEAMIRGHGNHIRAVPPEGAHDPLPILSYTQARGYAWTGCSTFNVHHSAPTICRVLARADQVLACFDYISGCSTVPDSKS